MAILSVVTYTIGPSIAKAILKLWLKDQGILPNVIPDLLDLLKSTAQGEREARQAARRIEDLGIQVVQQMQPVFDDASSALGDSGHDTVARELATTLAAAHLQPRVLVECNLDPKLLARHLTGVRPGAAKLLSGTEEALYRRLLAEAARAITEIASDLQGFDAAYAAASLQDNDQVLKMLTAIWQRPAQADQEFEDKYRAQVQTQLDKLELFGLPKMDATSRAQRLTRVYVTLLFEQHVRRMRHRPTSRDHQFLASLLEIREEEPPRPIIGPTDKPLEGVLPQKGDIDHLLAYARRVVIRGDAGSGKSTLLQWLAVRSSSRSFAGALAGWNNTIPFFIRLRERVDDSFPAPEEFPQLIAKTIAGTMPMGWVHRQLESGRALVLVDGVDELPQAKREELLQSLRGLVTAFPLARYIVTSRPAALKQDDWPAWSEWTTAEGFTDATLQPLTPDQVDLLIQQWHDALAEKHSDADEIAEIHQLPGSLRRTLRLRPALRRLTTNPLLCAMLCALHRDSRENLPSERLKLYEQCVEMLLTKRDEGRKVSLGPEYARLTPGQQRALVESFAYWMMRNDYSDVSMEDADEQFGSRLPALGSPPGADGVKVRRYFVERTSLLREPVEGRVDFTHRTFEEFLAAHQAVKENDLGFLIGKATDDLWRELIILAAGVARPREAASFLRLLVQRAQESVIRAEHHRLLLLANACLETCVELDPTTRAMIVDQASALFPPKDTDEIRLVSAAGDPAVPLLTYNPKHSPDQAVACIRTLAQIGSAAALQAIAGYMKHPAPEVREAIVGAWNLFDRAEFARQVLAKSDQLVIFNLTSWDGFEQLQQLKALAIVQSTPISDLRPLSQLTGLITFSLGQLGIPDEFRISDERRTEFYASELDRAFDDYDDVIGRITSGLPSIDLTPVASLPKLKRLILNDLIIRDLRPLASLTELTDLELHYTAVRYVTPLAGLTNLKRLRLVDNHVLDKADLAKLRAALPRLEIVMQ